MKNLFPLFTAAMASLALLLSARSSAQIRTLTKDDVTFDETTGTVVSYLSDYDQISIPNEFNGVSVRNIGAAFFSIRVSGGYSCL